MRPCPFDGAGDQPASQAEPAKARLYPKPLQFSGVHAICQNSFRNRSTTRSLASNPRQQKVCIFLRIPASQSAKLRFITGKAHAGGADRGVGQVSSVVRQQRAPLLCILRPLRGGDLVSTLHHSHTQTAYIARDTPLSIQSLA
jgi:hypothetical protein